MNRNTVGEKSRESAGHILLMVVLLVALIAIVAMLVKNEMALTGSQGNLPDDTNSGTETGEATLPVGTGNNDITCKGSYTVSDEEAAAAAEEIVATMGDGVLTNAELQVYYWMQVYDFLNEFGGYASMIGLDYAAPLDTQISMDGTSTWQQFFLTSAIEGWMNYQALDLTAAAAGYEMPEEYAAFLAGMPEQLEQSAVGYGFETALDMIQADMGPGATLEGYLSYMKRYYNGELYFSDVLNKIDLKDAEVEAYFDENAEAYQQKGLEKDDSMYVDVRHILVMPTGGTKDEDGVTTYSEEEWAACKQKAEEILAQWKSGAKTEESFAELANTYSEDGGSNTNGGLYTNVQVGDMVEPFEDWCFDESRKHGDYGLVQTNYGYHVMYFVDSNPVWFVTAWNDLMSQKGDELIQKALETYEAEIDYSAIKLGEVSLVSAS